MKSIFTGGFIGPKKAHLVDNGGEHRNRYDDCTLHNVGYFGEWRETLFYWWFFWAKKGTFGRQCIGGEHMNRYDDCTLHNVGYFGETLLH